MNDLSQDAWFFAQAGTKGGPIGFSELQCMAREGKLHPRQDLVWAKGMDRWQPAGEIQGLFERAPQVAGSESSVEKKATSASSANVTASPYVSPQKVGSYGQTGTAVAMPGARRRSYLFFLIVFPVLWAALVAGGSTFVNQKVEQELMALIASGLLVLPVFVTLVISVMRLINLGMSGWWFLGNLVPFLNLWVGYRCFACPAGYANHKKMDGVGIFLAILYWLMILAGVVAFAAIVAVILGELGSPELREQIVDAIKEKIQMLPNP